MAKDGPKNVSKKADEIKGKKIKKDKKEKKEKKEKKKRVRILSSQDRKIDNDDTDGQNELR